MSEEIKKYHCQKCLSLKFVFLRILIGGFFVWVGVDKIMEPHQNFLYVVQGYQLFPDVLEDMVAWVMPWVEFFMGLFLVLGLWLKWTLRGFLLLISAFIIIILQALIRKLPIKFCGCFGGLFSSDIRHTLLIDICLWLLVLVMSRWLDTVSVLSLDRYFSSEKK